MTRPPPATTAGASALPRATCTSLSSQGDKMSSRAGDLLYTCHLFLCIFAFVCVHGRGGGSNPSCQVALLVERGKSLEASLGQRTTLECPVDYCGKPIEVTWCKERDNCVDIIPNGNVEIMQTGSRNKRLVSSLMFKRISLDDTGFYRCSVKDAQNQQISHAINVKVSASNPSCEVELLVERGTSVAAALGQRTTLQCPVEHCGKSIRVTWCKERDTCVDIIQTDNLEITQTSSYQNHLLSSLTFKRISLDNAGLYRCSVKDDQTEQISHAITVKVSMLNQEVEFQNKNLENSQNVQNSGESHDLATDDSVISWLPFLLIGVGVAALVTIVIVLPVIKGYCQKRKMTFTLAQRQEMSTHTIPGLPPRSTTPTFVQQNQPIFLSPSSSQLAVNVDAHRPEGVVYSGVNHRLEAPGGGYFY